MTKYKEDFYEANAPLAMEQQIRYGIPASVTLAQMYIESGGGTSRLAKEGNNYFGIKATKSWISAGKPIGYYNDDRQHEAFRHYDSVESSVDDHSRFLANNGRYKPLFALNSDSKDWANKFAEGLQHKGYATSKNYAESLKAEIRDYNLTRYDDMAKQMAKEGRVPTGHKYENNPYIQEGANSGMYCFPLSGTGNLKVTSGFGHRDAPTSGASTNHQGVDFKVEKGKDKKDDVLATEYGTVVEVKKDMTNHDSTSVRQQPGNKGGNYITVRYDRAGGQSYFVSYLHLDENGVKVNVGDQVTPGQVIGRSGGTGNVTGPHLHLTVKTGATDSNKSERKVIDPMDYLAELKVRGGLDGSVYQNGRDLLASHKIPTNLQETPADIAMREKGNNNGMNMNNMSQNPLEMLAKAQSPEELLLSMMGSQSGIGQGGDILGGFMQMLFQSAVIASLQLAAHRREVNNEPVQEEKEPVRRTPEEEETIRSRRHEETISTRELADAASMEYDTILPQSNESGRQVSIS